jgi:hypothetical protein
MVAFLYYPLYLVAFWYKDVLWGLINFFGRFNHYLILLVSLNLLVKTFFKPLKNEYREGLVLFSILFGIALKMILITVLMAIMLVVVAIECFIAILVASMPIALLIVMLGINSPLWYE